MIPATACNAEILKNNHLREEKSKKGKSLNATAKKQDAVVSTVIALQLEVNVVRTVHASNARMNDLYFILNFNFLYLLYSFTNH